MRHAAVPGGTRLIVASAESPAQTHHFAHQNSPSEAALRALARAAGCTGSVRFPARPATHEGRVARTVASGGRDSARDSGSQADWLGRGHAQRERRWALPEQLFGPSSPPEAEQLLTDLGQRLSQERIALGRLEAELSARQEQVWELERRLEAIALDHDHAEDAVAEQSRNPPRRSVIPVSSTLTPDRDYWLTRCDGFLVEAPDGRAVGVVEGVRFGSRIDRPEQLEVAVGRVRRRLLLVSVDDVEYVSAEHELVVLNQDAAPRHDLGHTLLARARWKPQRSAP